MTDGTAALVHYWHHMAHLFMGLFASDGLARVYQDFRHSEFAQLRRRAQWARAKAAVRYDRVRAGEMNWRDGWDG